MTKEKIIAVFGSSRLQEGEAAYEEARTLGRALAENGFALCTGGYGGIMAGVSRGTKEAAAKTYGVTAESFSAKVNPWVDVEVRVPTWQDRLFELIRLADGFIACQGGTGTLVELAVVWEMQNKSVMPVSLSWCSEISGCRSSNRCAVPNWHTARRAAKQEVGRFILRQPRKKWRAIWPTN